MLKKILLAMIAIATVFTLASCSGDTPVSDGGSSKTLNVPEALWGDWTLMTEADEEAGLEASPMGGLRITKTTVDLYLDPTFTWDNLENATHTDITSLYKASNESRQSKDDMLSVFRIEITQKDRYVFSYAEGNTTFSSITWDYANNKQDETVYNIVKN